MALTKGSTTLASDFIALKARIKAECARRKYNGSVAQYASSSYDYTVPPVAGNHLLPEHYNKLIVPFNKLTGSNLQTKNVGDIVPYLSDVSKKLAELESYQPTDGSSGCKASCTGMCQGTCASGCVGCTGSCEGSCSNSCTSCSGGCSVVCYDGCDVGCYSRCAENCENACLNGCLGGCMFGCMGYCTGAVQNDVD